MTGHTYDSVVLSFLFIAIGLSASAAMILTGIWYTVQARMRIEESLRRADETTRLADRVIRQATAVVELAREQVRARADGENAPFDRN